MSYVLSAYGVTLLTLVVYGILLFREHRRLARQADEVERER